MSYMATHNRLRRVRGRAQTFACICGEQAQEWAYNECSSNEVIDDQGRRYSLNLDDYFALCGPCHRRYDKAINIERCPAGHEYVGHNVFLDSGKRKCRTCVYARNKARRIANPPSREKQDHINELQRQRRARSAA